MSSRAWSKLGPLYHLPKGWSEPTWAEVRESQFSRPWVETSPRCQGQHQLQAQNRTSASGIDEFHGLGMPAHTQHVNEGICLYICACMYVCERAVS